MSQNLQKLAFLMNMSVETMFYRRERVCKNTKAKNALNRLQRETGKS